MKTNVIDDNLHSMLSDEYGEYGILSFDVNEKGNKAIVLMHSDDYECQYIWVYEKNKKNLNKVDFDFIDAGFDKVFWSDEGSFISVVEGDVPRFNEYLLDGFSISNSRNPVTDIGVVAKKYKEVVNLTTMQNSSSQLKGSISASKFYEELINEFKQAVENGLCLCQISGEKGGGVVGETTGCIRNVFKRDK